MKGRRKYHRFSPKQRRELLNAFERSQLSAYAFARKNGVCYSTLRKWHREAQSERGNGAEVSMSFAEVDLPTTPCFGVTVKLGSAVSTEITSESQIALVAALIREVNGS